MTKDEIAVLINYPGFLAKEQIPLRDRLFHALFATEMSLSELEDHVIRSGIDSRFDFKKNIHVPLEVVQVEGRYVLIHPSHTDYFSSIIRLAIRDLFTEAETHDQAFKAILRFKLKVSHIWPNSFLTDRLKQPFARWSNGQLKDEKLFSPFAKSKAMCERLAVCTIEQNDIVGLNHMLKNKQMRKVLESNIDALILKFG